MTPVDPTTVSVTLNAAGIVFDATVIRALLVPALMRLLGDANWWMPDWTRSALLIKKREPAPEVITERG